MIDLRLLTNDQDLSAMETNPRQVPLLVPSHGEKMFGICRIPGGKRDEKFPCALLLHGLPGNEQNQDLNHALRRVGIVSALVHYRGAWGSGGTYRISNLAEDAAAAVEYLKEHAEEFCIDPERIYLVGHSMGCFASLHYLASHPAGIRGVVLGAPCDVAEQCLRGAPEFHGLLDHADDFLRCESPESLMAEVKDHADAWRFAAAAGKLDPSLPLLVICGDEDAVTPFDNNAAPLLAALKDNGNLVELCRLPSGHTFDNRRLTYIRTVAEWIAKRESE